MKNISLNLHRRLPHILLATLSFSVAGPAHAIDWNDPYAVGRLPATSAVGGIKTLATPCTGADVQGPLTVADVVDRALCGNPKSHEAWANARYQAAQIGVTRAAYLPSITANGEAGCHWNSGSGSIDYNQWSASTNLSYLLYDFGGRDAALENAKQLFLAASATQDSVV